MRDELNDERPQVMHIDLNSCFATVEQQARPRLRGRPVAIINRRTEHTAIVTASYEAKALGVKVGVKLRDAAKLAPGLIGIESDPPKYRHVYHKLMDIMQDYSAHVRMKSIDEGVIDFHEATGAMAERDLADVGREIKQRLRDEIGRAMRCNVGIGTNRFLAKTAAGLHKPDGLDVIDSQNLRQVLASLTLTDLTGIAWRNEARLNAVGILTPLEFLDAGVGTLRDVVFKSVVGEHWHQRLRGWEVDKRDFDVKRVGRQYVLEQFQLPHDEVLKRLHHLCESVGSRMRRQRKAARGLYVYAKTRERQYWHRSCMAVLPFSSDQAIYERAKLLFQTAPDDLKEIGVHCYELEEREQSQLSLFEEEIARERLLTDVVDDINARFGDRKITSAGTLGTAMYVREKIPFGSTRYL